MEEVIAKLDRVCLMNLPFYLIGGSALVRIGSKTTTKDIDIIMKNRDHLSSLIKALEKIGFRHDGAVTGDELVRTAMHLRNQEGLKFDIFVGNIAGKLEFSDEMVSRTIPYLTAS